MNAALESLQWLRSRLTEQRAECGGEDVGAGLTAALELIDEEIANQTSWEQVDAMSPQEVDAFLRSNGYEPDELVSRAKAKVAEMSGLSRLCGQPITKVAYGLAMWQPIATAPRDGTWVLLAGPSGYGSTPLRVEVCCWAASYRPLNPWRTHSGDAFTDGGAQPTHWMPLPPEPIDL